MSLNVLRHVVALCLCCLAGIDGSTSTIRTPAPSAGTPDNSLGSFAGMPGSSSYAASQPNYGQQNVHHSSTDDSMSCRRDSQQGLSSNEHHQQPTRNRRRRRFVKWLRKKYRRQVPWTTSTPYSPSQAAKAIADVARLFDGPASGRRT